MTEQKRYDLTLDHFRLIRRVVDEYAAHRALANHRPFERCPDCVHILSQLPPEAHVPSVTDIDRLSDEAEP